MSPLITIGVPVYNGAATLRKSLDCILAQSLPDFELLISDNASTDETQEICTKYAQEDQRIRYWRNNENIGAAANYNLLVSRASGRYFRWASHDDMCAPTHLEECVKLFEHGPPQAVLCYPKTLLIDAQDRPFEAYEDRLHTTHDSPSRRLHDLLKNLELCNAIMGLIRLDALRRTRGIAKFRSSDVVLLAELAMLGPILEVPSTLFLRRKDPVSFGVARLSKSEQAVWYDPSAQKHSPFIRTTLLREMLVSAAKIPATRSERFKCVQTVLRIWGPRYWRVIAGEFKMAARMAVGLPARSKHISASKLARLRS